MILDTYNKHFRFCYSHTFFFKEKKRKRLINLNIIFLHAPLPPIPFSHTFTPAVFAWSTAAARSLSEASTTLSLSSSSYYKKNWPACIRKTRKKLTEEYKYNILKLTKIWGRFMGSISSPTLWTMEVITSAKLRVSEVEYKHINHSTYTFLRNV